MKSTLLLAFILLSSSLSDAQTKLLINRKDGTRDTIALNALSRISFVPSVKPMIEEVKDYFSVWEQLYSIAVDRDSNLYVSVVLTGVNGGSEGIYKLTPDGIQTQYALRGTEPFWSSLKFGPGDTLIAARWMRALFYVDPKTVTSPKIYNLWPVNAAIADFDFDAQKNIWGGNPKDSAIYRIDRLKQVRTFPSIGHVKSIRIYDNALYVASEVPVAGDTTEAVYKLPFTAADTGLGTPEKYFDLRSAPGYEHNTINAITFDSSGTLYVGIDGPAGILVVRGANAKPEALYNGLIDASVLGFQWGPSTSLYAICEFPTYRGPDWKILKVDMHTQGAPYYGR